MPVTLSFCPCVLADIWKALITPVVGVYFVWSEAVVIDEARVIL